MPRRSRSYSNNSSARSALCLAISISSSTRPTQYGYSPAGFEKWFLDIGKPAENRTKKTIALAKPTFEEIQKAIEAAKTYGVEFLKE